MRIAVVSFSFIPNVGGAEFVVHNLANEWSAAGHEVIVFNAVTARAIHPEAKYAVRKYWMPKGSRLLGFGPHRNPWRWAATASLSRLLVKFRPDYVSGHQGMQVAFYLSSMGLKVPWSITCHGAEVSRTVWSGSERARYDVDGPLGYALNCASSVIAISGIAESSLRELQVRQSLIKRIPNGVRIAHFRKKVTPGVRQKLGLGSAAFVMTAGRNVRQKNLLLGLRAFSLLRRTHPDLKYLVAGGGCTQLQTSVEQLGIHSSVILSEGLSGDDLVAAYQQAELFLSTSHYEFCPLVVLEAMASGLPQVATRVPGTMDFVLDGETGFLTSPDDPEALANGIHRFLLSSDLRDRMRQNCFNYSANFEWSTIAEAYLSATLSDGAGLPSLIGGQ